MRILRKTRRSGKELRQTLGKREENLDKDMRKTEKNLGNLQQDQRMMGPEGKVEDRKRRRETLVRTDGRAEEDEEELFGDRRKTKKKT